MQLVVVLGSKGCDHCGHEYMQSIVRQLGYGFLKGTEHM